ncbi:glycoside hydrolase family 67 protein [Annulohypoxylon truncatum]|uniref:glycoside hydrolase family 67 protein n=1 Tax=Annulohypoxylon truncatum TaxID=327061 RepID=UPI002008953A|nr:glycoside hydrolase family 67 protein [Annulohypoxylon truncatum]KAI1210235.1 glycoside hydrolase family 67 protein [Annulohypoxylon truncatum]
MRGFWFLATLGLAAAEDGLNAWLRYARLPDEIARQATVPPAIVALNTTESSPVYSAGQELRSGINGILGKKIDVSHEISEGGSVVVGTIAAFNESGISVETPELEEDGFWLSVKNDKVEIVGQNERGALYGAFEYLSMLAQANFTEVAYATNPSAAIRWINQWDNMDGTIERGYAGLSIFFANDTVLSNMTRVAQYARLLASIRVNGIIVNNVNADVTLLSDENMAGLARIADAMRPWGVKVGISLNFASPQTFGGLSTFDPLDDTVIAWWNNITDKLYVQVPDMAGFLIKANSEGQPGPETYNRTLSDGANLFARATKPHGGVVMFRAFVYDYQNLNESNWKDDRANAAVDFFRGLDGKFDDNVIVQIKYGPIDFQVREPASPLFAHLKQTATAIELQITQEYLGQQCHLVYLPPLWKTVLDFDLRVDGEKSVIGTDILSGKRFNKTGLTGYAGVVNVGHNATWLGTHLAMSNLYAYGRIAWDPTVNEVAILEDWTRLTFGLDDTVRETITRMSMESWPAYENYTGNLGIQTLTDITGPHYGPNPQSMDNNPWGQWTRADAFSIGMDRTVSNGTGYSGQYPDEVAAMFEEIETTPDNLLLWFHHVPYTHVLKSGKTVIQHFYDAHYAGAETAASFPEQWSKLRGLIDQQRFDEMLFRLTYQAGHAIVWRDSINEFYNSLSQIGDDHDRVNNHPYRIEAENMTLTNYRVTAVNPFEVASSLRIVQSVGNSSATSASATLNYTAGVYDLAVAYYDLYEGKASYELFLNERSIGKWIGDNEDRLGFTLTRGIDGHSATRITFKGIEIKEGDVVRVDAKANGRETAPLDYIAVLPPGVVD